MPDRLHLPTRGRLSQRVHRFLAPLSRRIVLQGLRRLARGSVTLIDGEKTRRFGTREGEPGVTIRVHDPSFYSTLLLRGSVGAAEGYVLGDWECSDLTALARIVALNPQLTDGLLHDSAAALRRPALWLAHRLRRNTASKSRSNIAAHYDLGEDFFELFLDPTMTYSCAIFESDADTLEQAQIAKFERICRTLELRPGHRVLEIGTGWGSLAIHAARRYGCHVVTTTNSRAQFEFARGRVQRAGLENSVTVLNDDYREIRGRFDRVMAIEMVEAVGAEFLAVFFEACSRLMRSDGLLLLQAILTPDPAYASSLRSVDFIKRYIFPGGQLPSVGALCTAIARRTDLRLVRLEDLTSHYAATLRRWGSAFARNRARIANRGYPEPFLRLWELYLHSCEGYFAEHAVGVAQIAFAKPEFRPALSNRVLPHLSR